MDEDKLSFIDLLKEWLQRTNLPNVDDLRERTSAALFASELGELAGETLERTTQNSLEDNAILQLLKDSRRPHFSLDLDCWYSCPKSGDYCGDKPRDVCTCGADEWNERVNAMLASWGQDTQRAG